MIDALSAKKIGGAGLDVFEHEPLEAGSTLWDLENVILTRTSQAPTAAIWTKPANYSRRI